MSIKRRRLSLISLKIKFRKRANKHLDIQHTEAGTKRLIMGPWRALYLSDTRSEQSSSKHSKNHLVYKSDWRKLISAAKMIPMKKVPELILIRRLMFHQYVFIQNWKHIHTQMASIFILSPNTPSCTSTPSLCPLPHIFTAIFENPYPTALLTLQRFSFPQPLVL